MSEAPAIMMCIGFDRTDPTKTKQCQSPVAMGGAGDDGTTKKNKNKTRFCKAHTVRVRGHYLQYKQLTQHMQDWYQRIMQDQHPQMESLKKIYGLLDYVGSLRRKFTQSQVHPSCRDQGHRLAEHGISSMKTSVERRLRQAFLLGAKKKAVTATVAVDSESDKEEQEEGAGVTEKEQQGARERKLQLQKQVEKQQERDVQLYLASCISENMSVEIRLMLDASQAFRRAFFQVWMWLERRKLLSGALLQAWYQEQLDGFYKGAPFPMDVESVKHVAHDALLAGCEVAAEWGEQNDDDAEDGGDGYGEEFEEAYGQFLECILNEAISTTHELVHPERPTVARTIFIILEHMFLQWFGGEDDDDGESASKYASQCRISMSLLWMAAISPDTSVNEKVLSEGNARVTAHVPFFRQCLDFFAHLDLEMQSQNWGNNLGDNDNDDDNILNMKSMIGFSISASRANKKAVLQHIKGGTFDDSARRLLELCLRPGDANFEQAKEQQVMVVLKQLKKSHPTIAKQMAAFFTSSSPVKKIK